MLLVFAGVFLAPLVVAVGVAVYSRMQRPRITLGRGARARAGRRRLPPKRMEWRVINEFARRRDRFTKWSVSVLICGLVLWVSGLPLTGIGGMILGILYLTLVHLRCPRCEATVTAHGMTDGMNCLACGTRLKY